MSYAYLVPPICDPRDGHLLIDGCYTENVPGKPMKEARVKYILVSDIASVDERNLTKQEHKVQNGEFLMFLKCSF